MRLFNRVYKLTIGQPIIAKHSGKAVPYRSLGGQITNDLDVSQNASETNASAVVLTEHNVTFSIEKVSSKSANACEITIMNPSDATMAFLQEVSGKKPLIMLEAGYEGNTGKIFIGNVDSFKETFTNEDRFVEITCSDGGEVIRNATFVNSYPKGTANATIAEDIVKTFGLAKGKVTLPEGTTKVAINFSGRSMEEANRFLEPYGLGLAIQDMTVYIDTFIAGLSTPPTQNVPYITPNSGQIGSVAFLDDSTSDVSADRTAPRGITLTTLLRHDITPSNFIAADLKGVKTTFKVTKVTHSGGYENDEWQTEIEAEEVL